MKPEQTREARSESRGGKAGLIQKNSRHATDRQTDQTIFNASSIHRYVHKGATHVVAQQGALQGKHNSLCKYCISLFKDTVSGAIQRRRERASAGS